MLETLGRRRWITKRQTRQSARAEVQHGEFITILTFSLLGLALSLFAIGKGWLGDTEYVVDLFLLL